MTFRESELCLNTLMTPAATAAKGKPKGAQMIFKLNKRATGTKVAANLTENIGVSVMKMLKTSDINDISRAIMNKALVQAILVITLASCSMPLLAGGTKHSAELGNVTADSVHILTSYPEQSADVRISTTREIASAIWGTRSKWSIFMIWGAVLSLNTNLAMAEPPRAFGAIVWGTKAGEAPPETISAKSEL